MKFFKVVVLLGALLCSLDHVRAEQVVTGGGDSLRKAFLDAREILAAKVLSLKPCSFDSSVAKADIEFLMKNAPEIVDDLMAAVQNWVVDSQPTCAWTTFDTTGPIYLSYPTCSANIRSQEDVNFVLAHETMHRLGIRDELHADQLAMAILKAKIVVSCPASSGSCVGSPISKDRIKNLLGPGSTFAIIGKYSFVNEQRDCNDVTGCTAWVPWDGLFYHVAFTGRRELALVVNGSSVQVRLIHEYCSADHTTPGQWYGAYFNGVGSKEISTERYSYVSSVQWGGSGGTSCSSSEFHVGHADMALKGVFTDHCMEVVATGSEASSIGRKEYKVTVKANF